MERTQASFTLKMRTREMVLPRPTAWPIVLAVGLGLIFASLVTNYWPAFFGVLLTAISSVGWFREVLPVNRHETISVTAPDVVAAIRPERIGVNRIEVDETHRAQLPLETYHVSSGIRGGIAGGLAMIIPAEIYGIVRYHSVWYVVNLLGGAGVVGWTNPTPEDIVRFHLGAFLTANLIQGIGTLLVGLLYGALLPLWPKRPILLGGLVGPVLWTGLLHSILGTVNPYFNQHVDWWSFAAAQVFFGVVAGYTVTKVGKVKRLAQVPLPIRLGIEAPGLISEEHRTASEAKKGSSE